MAFPKLYIGNVGTEGVSTGPHIHEYVKNRATGKYIDPRTLQEPLLGLRVGQNEVPMFIKNAQGQITLNPESGGTVTSEFGSRSSPTAGASSFHQGRDIAFPQGTQIKYVGGGTYTPNTGVQGFGNLGVLTTPDNKYDIGFGHMSSLGQASKGTVTSTTPPGTGQPSNYDDAQKRTKDLLEAFMYGTQYDLKKREAVNTPQSFADKLKSQILTSLLSGGNTTDDQSQITDINSQLQQAIFG